MFTRILILIEHKQPQYETNEVKPFETVEHLK